MSDAGVTAMVDCAPSIAERAEDRIGDSLAASSEAIDMPTLRRVFGQGAPKNLP
jgi:hypothetical protein